MHASSCVEKFAVDCGHCDHRRKVPRHEKLLENGGIIPRFLNLSSRWNEWSYSGPDRLNPGERVPCIHLIGVLLPPKICDFL
jgi:hypothetical protein